MTAFDYNDASDKDDSLHATMNQMERRRAKHACVACLRSRPAHVLSRMDPVQHAAGAEVLCGDAMACFALSKTLRCR